LREDVELESLGQVAIRGKAQPVEVFAVISDRKP